MNHFFAIIALILTSSFTFSQQSDYIQTTDSYILGPCGDTLNFKGVNYAPYNWGYDINDEKINQIALSGANSVRIVWYQDNPDVNTLYSNSIALDSVISKCIQNDLVVILELHDVTCSNNASLLTQTINWWTSAEILTILEKYKHSIIVNIANEALYVNWTGNSATALIAYNDTYEDIISALRNAPDFNYPLLIDAPDCGQNSDAFVTSNTAQNLINFDPLHNLIFSAHAYWYGFAGNDSTQMANKINSVKAQNIPFILGEIANQQDDVTMCQYNLNYQALLNYCEVQNVSWFAWTWDHDVCTQRQMTVNGNFSNLTTYGNDLINNSNYGMINGTVKSKFLVDNGCSLAGTSMEMVSENSFQLFPNPTNGVFSIQLNNPDEAFVIYVNDFSGRLCYTQQLIKGQSIQEIRIDELENGMYFVTLESNNLISPITSLIKN